MVNLNTHLNSQEEEFYHKHIKLKVESGLPRTEYCKLHGLNYRKFGYYERSLALVSDFVPIKLTAQEELKPATRLLCSVIFKNGAELKVHDAIVLPSLIALMN
jgi:hypothetical protein